MKNGMIRICSCAERGTIYSEPVSGFSVPFDGIDVVDSPFWRRRIKAGDVVLLAEVDQIPSNQTQEQSPVPQDGEPDDKQQNDPVPAGDTLYPALPTENAQTEIDKRIDAVMDGFETPVIEPTGETQDGETEFALKTEEGEEKAHGTLSTLEATLNESSASEPLQPTGEEPAKTEGFDQIPPTDIAPSETAVTPKAPKRNKGKGEQGT